VVWEREGMSVIESPGYDQCGLLVILLMEVCKVTKKRGVPALVASVRITSQHLCVNESEK
jgi:hypothetical protein